MMIEHRAYCWRHQNGGWQVGMPLLIDGEMHFRSTIQNVADECRVVDAQEEIAMQPSHAGMPTWVPVSELKPYPLEPIDEPMMHFTQPPGPVEIEAVYPAPEYLAFWQPAQPDKKDRPGVKQEPTEQACDAAPDAASPQSASDPQAAEPKTGGDA